jgi:hypothetical protein
MAEALTTCAKLLTIREVREDTEGAVLHFQDGADARLPLLHADYAAYLRLVRRSQERQHPIGVRLADGRTVGELHRADNDVPAQLLEDGRDGSRVLFQGHDGVFHLPADHPASCRLHTLLDEAIRRKAHVWFIAHKPDLTLLDVQPAGWAMASHDGACSGDKTSAALVPKTRAGSSHQAGP